MAGETYFHFTSVFLHEIGDGGVIEVFSSPMPPNTAGAWYPGSVSICLSQVCSITTKYGGEACVKTSAGTSFIFKDASHTRVWVNYLEDVNENELLDRVKFKTS